MALEMALGPLMIGIRGPRLEAEEREWLLHPKVGGVVLFERNLEDPPQLAALVAEIHALRRPPLLVAVDQEGGRVQRFRKGFVALPPPRALGRLHDRAGPEAARRAAELIAWLGAAELRAVGVDLNLAPVLDLDAPPGRRGNPVLAGRAFHHQPEVVAELGLAWQRGVAHAGMAAVAKHFPGHGGVLEDTHHREARDPRTLQALWDRDLLPFRSLIRAGLGAVMMGHVAFPGLDEVPAGRSARWIGEVLRARLGFEGAVLSDDLGMAGAGEGDLVDRARAALAAGCDLLLACNGHDQVPRLLDGLPWRPNALGAARLARLHGRGQVRHRYLRLLPGWEAAQGAIEEAVSAGSAGPPPGDSSPT